MVRILVDGNAWSGAHALCVVMVVAVKHAPRILTWNFAFPALVFGS